MIMIYCSPCGLRCFYKESALLRISVEQIDVLYCSATPALYGICSTASQFESPSGRHYFVVVWQLSGALVSKLPCAPQLPHRKSDCRLFTHFHHILAVRMALLTKKGVEQIELVYCSATPTLYGICSTASQFESLSRRHYFVVMCQLSAAYVSKLPRATLSSHRKSDCRLFTHFSPYPRGAYGTAHKKGVEPIG